MKFTKIALTFGTTLSMRPYEVLRTDVMVEAVVSDDEKVDDVHKMASDKLKELWLAEAQSQIETYEVATQGKQRAT